uniref:Uncharacterized protein n=1 Tax=Rhizophora mucronata TaxID=61149 RepID=A0A2P2IZU5_RHIMU
MFIFLGLEKHIKIFAFAFSSSAIIKDVKV